MATYLDMLDQLIRAGLQSVEAKQLRPHLRFVMSRQIDSGAFTDGRGGTSLAETDFAVRIACLLEDDAARLLGAGEDCTGCFRRCGVTRPVAAYLARQATIPATLRECFHWLNLRRLLAATEASVEIDSPEIAGRLLEWWDNGEDLLTVANCFECLDLQIPSVGAKAEALLRRRRDDGGFGDMAATSQAVAFCALCGELPEDIVPGLIGFVAKCQRPAGGFAPGPDGLADLPSTFAALLTLWTLQGAGAVDLVAAEEFIGGVALPTGGFGQPPNIESTFHALASLALLHQSNQAPAAGTIRCVGTGRAGLKH